MRMPLGQQKIGIVAGGGGLPVSVARSAMNSGRAIHIIGIEGEAEESISEFSHSWFKWGELGRLLQILKEEKCRQVVIIGSVSRPDLSQVHFDFGAIRNLPFILSLMVGGDNSVLAGIVKFFEKHGFDVRGAHDVAPELVCPGGVLGKCKPNKQDEKDIEIACRVVKALGALDVGQAAVAARGYVLAVEAAEGTDKMLERCAVLRQWGSSGIKSRSGVLVKAPKPSQELRVDMPAIGSQTITLAAEAGLAGVALMAEHVLLTDRCELIEKADAAGLFVIGVSGECE